MVALARRLGTNVTLLSGQWYCSGIASCVFCEGVLSEPRRREMDVALPYASWDTVRMKWRPNLRRGYNCYEICTRLRRTMKARTRKRYRQVVIIIVAGPVGCREKPSNNHQWLSLFFLKSATVALHSHWQAKLNSSAPQLFSVQQPQQQPKTGDPDTVLFYPVSLLCRASCTVRCTLKPAHAIWLGKFGDSRAFIYQRDYHTGQRERMYRERRRRVTTRSRRRSSM